MEKEAFFGGEQMPPCYLNLNWDQSLDQNAQFESALSSLVSSPNSNPNPNPHHHPHAATSDNSVVIRELIGRLGSICNSGEISPTSNYRSTNNSGYNTPLNSPPKLNLMPVGPGKPMGFAGPDPGFADRAARFSCFGGRGFSGLQELGKLSRASSSQSLKGPQLDSNGGGGGGGGGGGENGGQEESSVVSDRKESNGRKRKAATTKGKGKEANLAPKANDDEDSGTKRCKSSEAEPKIEQDGKEGNNVKPAELPKLDYIHVRARRGQATDSHSLAERVRREKISERMKFLQDLVPGCNKVTGKAVMLDEIINYVQSLQRQVEFLSMKLATVNPRLDFNVDSLIPKDMHQPRGPMPPHSVFPLDATSSGFSYGSQPQILSLQSLMANGIDTQSSVNHLDAFVDASSHLGAFWEDDLQSVVQMGFGQNQETVFSSQAFQGSLPMNNMKIEL